MSTVPYRCKNCGEKLPVRERSRKGRIREYCGPTCRKRADRKRLKENGRTSA